MVRKELNRRHKQWSQALQAAEGATTGAVEGRLTIDDMAALLAPKAGRRGSSKADAVRLTLGLPNGEMPHPWPTQSEVAARLDITQASVSRHLRAAAKEWASLPWLTAVRDELVDVVAQSRRVMTSQELAGALRARRGAEEGAEARKMARALAVVRAAVEAEMWVGLHGPDAEAGPRLAVLRRGHRVLIALESLPGSQDPSAPEMADCAQALGDRADDLVAGEPLPGRGAVIRELRAITPPDGLAPLADTRLVELAAAASRRAAASPRLELYPVDLDLVRALRISQAVAGVQRERGITQADLLARVRARFPGVAVDERLTHVELEDALHKAGFPLEYDPSAKLFRPPAPDLPRLATTSSTSATTHARNVSGEIDPREVLAGKLDRSVERGGFLALTLRGKYLPDAAEALSARLRVRPVHVDREFLAAFRALVAEREQDWNKVRSLDARFGETGQISSGLASYVETTWERVRTRVMALAEGEPTVLFWHHASLLARYFDQGGRTLLTGMQNAARRPQEAPHGLWLLCPGESARDTPQLDGRIVEVLSDAERVVLDRGFLTSLRGEAGNAA